MPSYASSDDTPVDALAPNEMKALLAWVPWIMSGGDSLVALCQEIDVMGLALGGNPTSALDRVAILFQGMSDDLARAAESMRQVAADRKNRVSGGN